MQRGSLDGWPADVARASVVWILYVGGAVLTFVVAWGGGGIPVFVLFILTLIFGPFAAADIACRVVPADCPLILSLGWGAICGLIFFLFLGFSVVKLAQDRYPGVDSSYIFTVLIIAGPFLGALAFSRLKLRNPA